MRLIDCVRDGAIASLRGCSTEIGLKASGRRVGHHQVWARDSMIALLGGALVDDPTVRRSLRDSLGLLRELQAPSGCIPNNVDAHSRKPNFRATADGGLWWIVGSSILDPDLETTARILDWYDCQDVDRSGLVSMQESADWQDLFCTRGKGLYVNCLYVLALNRAADMAEAVHSASLAAAWRERARIARERINRYFWYPGDRSMWRHIAHTFSTETPQEQDSLGRPRWLPVKRLLPDEQYYLPYLAFRTPGEWFDVLGNLLAILAGVADAHQAEQILRFIERHAADALPCKSIYPPVQPGDPDWRDYYGMLNMPDQYHNGGIWPFIGGFYVAALVKAGKSAAAEESLERLAELNRSGEFNEWHHGATLEPMGVRDQAWSAGMYLYAYECVRLRNAIFIS